MTIFSSAQDLQKIADIIFNYIRLPFSSDTIPGNIMEHVIAHVKQAEVLSTYDFVDVISNSSKCGWQVKSTKDSTPLTWKRAKIPNSSQLISDSNQDEEALQLLGHKIIDFCNYHAQKSLELYNLNEIGYSRLIVRKNDSVTYFERLLITKDNPQLFKPQDFKWSWSKPKKTKGKEQLPALHGVNIHTNKKCWAWHGLGENQLHFSGEKDWWPVNSDSHAINFSLPSDSEKLTLEDFIELLSSLESPS